MTNILLKQHFGELVLYPYDPSESLSKSGQCRLQVKLDFRGNDL
jgi:hypothetical protein